MWGGQRPLLWAWQGSFIKVCSSNSKYVAPYDYGQESESDMQTNCDGLALLPHPAKNLFITVQTYTGSSYQLVIV